MPVKMKVCNAADYNEALKKRGRIFHLFDDAIKVWLDKDVLKKDKCKNVYSKKLIELLAAIRYLLKYPYRQLEGLLADYVQFKGLTLPVPDFSTLSRRMAKMKLKIRDYRSTQQKQSIEKLKIVLDSTGINIYHTSDGHGKNNSALRKYHGRAQTRKFHVALDAESKDIVSMQMTSGLCHDSAPVKDLLRLIPNTIEKVYADGAYDFKKVRAACVEKNAKQIIPPRKDAVLRPNKDGILTDRNSSIEFINSHSDHEEGRRAWKESESYGTRSYVEAFFGRFKGIFGDYFMCRSESARENELIAKTNLLNYFNTLGRAVFEKVA